MWSEQAGHNMEFIPRERGVNSRAIFVSAEVETERGLRVQAVNQKAPPQPPLHYKGMQVAKSHPLKEVT